MKVLDKGFIEYVDHMGSDLTIVNSARVSFGKHKDQLDERDKKLIHYLHQHNHSSVFRHCYITFRIKAPIFVFRQWLKHRIGSEFNEMSLRYVEFDGDFYIPDVFRKQSKINKQGSEGHIENHQAAYETFVSSCENSLDDYYRLLKIGVCREQARSVLPMGIYSMCYWTCSLQALMHFLTLREDGHAQFEIQEYARAARKIASEFFPVALSLENKK